MSPKVASPDIVPAGNWWHQFVRPYIRRSDPRTLLPPKPSFPASVFPLLIFALSVFISTYYLYSSEYFVNQTLAKAEAEARTATDLERLEHTREGLEWILRNPGVRMLVSAEMTFTVTRSYLGFLLLVWIFLSLLSGKWHLFSSFWLLSSSSLSVLSLGVLVNGMLKVLFLRETVAISPLWLLDSQDSQNLVVVLFAQCDLFFLWFCALVAKRAPMVYEEKSAYVFAICISSWAILLLYVRFVMEAGFTLLLN